MIEAIKTVRAINELYARRAKNKEQVHVDNGDDAFMHYYCKACDEHILLPVLHASTVPDLCFDCGQMQKLLELKDEWYRKVLLVEWTEDETGLTGHLITPLGIPQLYLRRAVHLGKKSSFSECVVVLGEDGFTLFDPDTLFELKADERQLWMSRVRSVASADLHDHVDNIGYNLMVVDGKADVCALDFNRDFTGVDWFLVYKQEEV